MYDFTVNSTMRLSMYGVLPLNQAAKKTPIQQINSNKAVLGHTTLHTLLSQARGKTLGFARALQSFYLQFCYRKDAMKAKKSLPLY